MEWRDHGILLGTTPFGETAVIVELYETFDEGVVAELVDGFHERLEGVDGVVANGRVGDVVEGEF